MSENAKRPQRRSFLGMALGMLGAGLAVLIGAPAVAFLGYPVTRETVRRGGGLVPIGAIDSFPVGKPVRVEVRTSLRDAWSRFDDVRVGAIWIIRDGERSLRALSATCPHLGCSVDFVATAGRFECPCHASAFAPDGEKQTGPAPRGMDPLHAELQGDTVLIEYKRFKPERADRVEA